MNEAAADSGFQPEEAREFADGGRGGAAAADGAVNDDELAMRAIGLGVDVADELGAEEDGKRVVAAGAFMRRCVNLPRVIEIPDGARRGAMIDDGIEGSEQERGGSGGRDGGGRARSCGRFRWRDRMGRRTRTIF